MHTSAPWATWNRQRIRQAALDWAEAHGRRPGAEDWRRATPETPNDSTVLRVYGSWNAMIRACGWTPNGAHRPRRWTREACHEKLFVWIHAHGRLPHFKDWEEPSLERPSARQVLLLFGSWNAMIVSGGYTPAVMYRTRKGYAMQMAAQNHVRGSDGTFQESS